MAVRTDEIDLARDRELVEAWQAGDSSAFDDLYRRYFDRIRSYCQRRVGDRGTAEELAQEAFVRALHALPRLRGERRFYPWMTVIASRLCIDHHRRNRRVEPTAEIDLGVVEDDHHARLSLAVDLEHLNQAMGRLGTRQAEVLDLRERRGLTYDEIAGELGVSHATVEALLFRARRALRREFRLLSTDRLVAIPAVGWLVARLGRTRDRLTLVAPDLGALSGPLAAGVVSVMLAAIPATGTPRPIVATTEGRPPSAVAEPPRHLADAPAAETTASPPPRPGGATPIVAPNIQPTTGEDARREASTMPIQLDLGHAGGGVDPAPVLDRIPKTTSERTLP